MFKHWITGLLAAALSAVMVLPAWGITLEDAARKVAEEYDARVLSAKTVTRDGKRVHEIRVITAEGVVKTVRVPEDS
jgi:hypothetical protein